MIAFRFRVARAIGKLVVALAVGGCSIACSVDTGYVAAGRPCTAADPPLCLNTNTRLFCDNGVERTEPCLLGCNSTGAEAHCNECVPDEVPLCNTAGDAVESCDSEGRSVVEPCLEGCQAGADVCNVCSPGLDYCAADGNVHGCDANGQDTGVIADCGNAGCTAATCDVVVVPSNVPSDVLASGTTSPGLASFGAVLAAAGAVSGDIVVIDPDDGGIELFDSGGGWIAIIRASGTGEDNGIYFDTATQSTEPDLGIFFVTDFDVPAGITVRADGDNALIIVAMGCVVLDGDLLAGAGCYLTSEGAGFDLGTDDAGVTCGLGSGGAGGWDADCATCDGLGPGFGGDGNVSGSDYTGGGGAGFGGNGGRGGDETDSSPGRGEAGERYYCGGTGGTSICGMATDYNGALSPLVGGSSGGGGGESSNSGEGGAGGGAVQLVALSACGVTITGSIDVGGEGGRGATSDERSGGGGGSGGAILLEGFSVTVAGGLTANGGGGGGGDDGGGTPTHGDRGRLDMMVAAGAPPCCMGGGGGDGGAGGSLDGTDGGDDDDGPGGGGGGAGRIRINAAAIDTSGSLMSPSTGTTANTTGPTP